MEQNNQFPDDYFTSDNENDYYEDSETFGNNLKNVPNYSEPQPNVSETIRKDAETMPNVSETKKESFGNKENLSEQTPEHTLSVREVARLFEEAGAPRTERSIINWCNPNKRGIKRLNCFFDTKDRKYFVTPQSVHNIIKEERKKQQYTDFNVQDFSEPQAESFGNLSEKEQNDSETLPNVSESVRNDAESTQKGSEPLRKEPETIYDVEQNNQPYYFQNEDENKKLKALENELNDLRITNKAKDYFIDRLQEQSEKERQSYIEERAVIIEQLTNSSKKIGELETKLLQIEAPRRDLIDTVAEEKENFNLVSKEQTPTFYPQNSV